LKQSDFFLFKGYVNTILTRLGITKFQVLPVQSTNFSEGLSYQIGSEHLVEFGTVKKSILKQFDIKQQTFFADFNWDLVLKSVSTKIKLNVIPKYPEVRRDLSLLVTKDVSFDALYKVARQTENNY